MTFELDHPSGSVPIKTWTRGVTVDENAREQMRNLAKLPFIHKHVAAMPDVHWGIGATIGSVIPTKGAIIPAAVGVDIGCGMMAYRTTLKASDLPDNLALLRSDIEQAVPHGFTTLLGLHHKGGWTDPPSEACAVWNTLFKRYHNIWEKHTSIGHSNALNQLGSLGGGNHFIEICLDEDQAVWVMLHSGSRGAGNLIGRYFIEKAKEEMRRYFINLPDVALAYLAEGSALFDDYIEAVEWAQDYARQNRELMMRAVLGVLQGHTKPLTIDRFAVNCHHNYVARESHFGANVWVTRKGAVRARRHELGIIPGSMGTKSYIVEGLGNPESFMSCSHGAGRRLGRNEAKRTISLEEHIEATKGIECRKDLDVIDETPAAYKDIDAVMAAQADLVKTVAVLHQVLNVKVSELIDVLAHLPPDQEVIMATDPEGNYYLPVAGIRDNCIYKSDSGEVFGADNSAEDERLGEEEWQEMLKLPRCVVLYLD